MLRVLSLNWKSQPQKILVLEKGKVVIAEFSSSRCSTLCHHKAKSTILLRFILFTVVAIGVTW